MQHLKSKVFEMRVVKLLHAKCQLLSDA